MSNRKLRCLGCRDYFHRESGFKAPVGFFHSSECAYSYSTKKAAKKTQKDDKRQHKLDKERVKTKGQWLKEAQASFNKFIRIRDSKEPCISCQRHHQGQYHAGHYRTVGGSPELRFNELNNHKQCSACNNFLSGNIADYRINLIKKIGIDKVEWIEGPHEAKKYSIEEIKQKYTPSSVGVS